MYLSQLILNERQSRVHRDLGNAHKFHQRIMQAFPDEENCDSPREDWHILFRHEPDSNVVLVQSAIQPNWSKLPEGYLQRQAIKSVALYRAEVLELGRVFQFRLRANPSKRDKVTRKTIGFFKQADQLSWLERQGDRCGFRLHSADVIPSPNVFGIKQQGTAPIRITTALFQGILEVTAPELLLAALQQGIGKGKSYGCGLLSIDRIRA